MKTPREKAIDYCMEVEGQIHQPYIDAFLAGYESANEWISVEDELPENEMYISAKNDKEIDKKEYFVYQSSLESFLKANFTHWKPIN